MKSKPPEPRLTINNLTFKLTENFARVIKSKRQIIKVLQRIAKNNVIEKDELRMIERTLQISERQVRDVMIPRTKMIFVQDNQKMAEFLPQIIASAHSRFPVMNKEGKVLGILLAKDLLPYVNKANGKLQLKGIIHPAIFIPESKRLNVLLDEFRTKRLHMAIVENERGQTAGLITIEDVLEEIVGEIEDEHDTRKNRVAPITKLPLVKDTYRVKASTSIDDFNNYFNSNLADEEVDSIGGVIIKRLQKIPKKGENITLGNMEVKVLKTNKKNLEELQVRKGKRD